MFDQWLSTNLRWVPATCIVATGFFMYLRHEAPQVGSSRPAVIRQEPRRAASAQDIQTEFSRAAGETDRVKRDARLEALAGRWIDASPEDALDFAFGLPPGEVRVTFLRQLCVAWARKNAIAALAWSDRLADTADRSPVRSTVCIAVAESDPRLALGLALSHGSEGDGSGGLLENLSSQWADREPVAALDWVRTQPVGEWHDRLLARMAFVLSRSDPLTAASVVAREIPAGPHQDEAVVSVVHQWALVDPDAAFAWIDSFPPSDLKDRALSELVLPTGR